MEKQRERGGKWSVWEDELKIGKRQREKEHMNEFDK